MQDEWTREAGLTPAWAEAMRLLGIFLSLVFVLLSAFGFWFTRM